VEFTVLPKRGHKVHKGAHDMKPDRSPFLLFAIVLALTIMAAGSAALPNQNQASPEVHHYVYHDHPSNEPLPDTMDPALFKDNHAAFVAYTLASQIKQTLYQVPCYCPCDKKMGHQSLLDCYANKHGVGCQTCQKEVIFCFLQHKKHKSPAQIRGAMAKGKAAKLDLPKYTERFYKQLAVTTNGAQ